MKSIEAMLLDEMSMEIQKYINLQKLQDFKNANKSINLFVLHEFKGLINIMNLNISDAIQQKLILQERLLRKKFLNSDGINGIKQLLTMSGCESWEQIANNPKSIFSQIDSNLLFYVIVILASKATEDETVPLNFLTKLLGVYSPPKIQNIRNTNFIFRS